MCFCVSVELKRISFPCFALTCTAALFHFNSSMEPGGRIIIGLGSTVTALETLAADRVRAWAFDYVTDLFARERLTAIVNPTVGVEVPVLSEDAKLRGESNTPLVVKMMKHIFIANLLGLPGYSVPVGQVPAEGAAGEPGLLLPVGLHLLGNHWEDHKVSDLRDHLTRLCPCTNSKRCCPTVV